MPAFVRRDQLIAQHKVIHDCLGKLESHVQGCLQGSVDLRWDQIKGILDSFGPTLWKHLEDEVRELSAEEMRKYWIIAEMSRAKCRCK